MSTAQTQQKQVGPHTMWIEDDTFFNTNRGPITPAQLQEFLDAIQDIRARHGYVFAVTDVSNLTAIPAEVRRMCAEWARNHNVDAAVVCGATITARAVIALISRAMTLFRPNSMVISFFDSADQARPWLSEQRQRIRAALGK